MLLSLFEVALQNIYFASCYKTAGKFKPLVRLCPESDGRCYQLTFQNVCRLQLDVPGMELLISYRQQRNLLMLQRNHWLDKPPENISSFSLDSCLDSTFKKSIHCRCTMHIIISQKLLKLITQDKFNLFFCLSYYANQSTI